MKNLNTVTRVGTPLHEQLLVLIPMLKALEDQRTLFGGNLPPILLEVERHRDGALTIDLSDAPAKSEKIIQPELTLTIYNGSRGGAPLSYQHAFILCWTYLSKNTPMNSIEYDAMYRTFWMSWAVQLFEYEQSIKALGIA